MIKYLIIGLLILLSNHHIVTAFKDTVERTSWVHHICKKMSQYNVLIIYKHCMVGVEIAMESKNVSDDPHASSIFKDAMTKWSQQLGTSPIDEWEYKSSMGPFISLFRGEFQEIKNSMSLMGITEVPWTEKTDSQKVELLTAAEVNLEIVARRGLLPIWSHYWNLTLDEKFAAVERATQVVRSIYLEKSDLTQLRLYRPFNRVKEVEARMLVNLGHDVSELLTSAAFDDVEKNILRAGMSYIRMDVCAANSHIQEAIKHLPIGSDTDVQALTSMSSRLSDMCLNRSLRRVIEDACQIRESFPLADVLKTGLKSHPVASYERLFWANIALGDCETAKIFQGNCKAFLKDSHIMYNAKEYFKDMDNAILGCQSRATTITALPTRFTPEQLETIKNEATLHGSKSNKSLARAAAVLRFPKLLYSPCTGPILEKAKDQELLLHKLEEDATQPKEGPSIDDHTAMLVGYLKNDQANTKKFAANIMSTSDLKSQDDAKIILACMTLCNSNYSVQDACLASSQFPPNHLPIKQMVTNICSEATQPIKDPAYVREGPTARPLSIIFDRNFASLTDWVTYTMFRELNAEVLTELRPQRPKTSPPKKLPGEHQEKSKKFSLMKKSKSTKQKVTLPS